jgi:hypothetical protein
MAKTQNHPVGNDFKANVLQENLFELFQYAHDHVVRKSFPLANEGSIRDIVIVDDGTSTYICVKTSRGWFKTSALTSV